MNISQSDKERIKQIVVEKIRQENSKPFTVAILGQTGVGKSSLLNALFGTKLKTDAIRPCTKEIEHVVVKGEKNSEMWFYDMPGIGESEKADTQYLMEYKTKLLESDVVLWAMHADNRSVAFEKEAFNQLLSTTEDVDRVRIMSKIIFVLTKVDLLVPPAWVFSKLNQEYGLFDTLEATEKILYQKEVYYRETFLDPYAELIISQTYNDSKLAVKMPYLRSTDSTVYYRGMLNDVKANELKKVYPNHVKIFDRLLDNYRVIPCSSLFRYNLQRLMLIIINKLGEEAVGRFQKFSSGNLSYVRVDKAMTLGNIIVFDAMKKQVVFDLSQHKV